MAPLCRFVLVALALAALAMPPRASAELHAGSGVPVAAARAADTALARAKEVARRGGPTGRELSPVLLELVQRYSALDPPERRQARILLARPTDGEADPQGDGYTVPEAAPHCSESFCVHYVTGTADAPSPADADTDGVPDYVELMAETFEHVRAAQNTGLGWRAPVSDGVRGGVGGRTDVYIKELAGRGILGYAAIDPGQSGSARFGYMVMDDDYADRPDPVAVLRATAAHEYNHVLQFAYDVMQDTWLFESTAVWMEDRVYDELDDYLRFLPSWATLDEEPLAKDLAAKHYGSAVWNVFLDERHGPQLIRQVWERSTATTPASFAPAAYDAALRDAGQPGFTSSFGTFSAAVAEWRTAARFSEGAAFPDVERRGSLAVGAPAIAPLLDHTTFAFYTVRPPASGWPPVVRLDGELPAGVAGALALVGRTGADPASGTVTTAYQELPGGGAGSVELRDPGSYGRVTVALVNADAQATRQAGDWRWAHDDEPFTASVSAGAGTPAAPVNTVRPRVDGVPRDGETLEGDRGVWTGSAPITYAWQWQRCDSSGGGCADLAGETGSTYVVREQDIGRRLRLLVTAANGEGQSTAESDPTAVVAAVPPSSSAPPEISDSTPRAGQTLTTTDGSWTGSRPMTFAYRWRRCTTTSLATCADVPGATASSYTVADGDAGRHLRILVTATNSAGSASRISAATQQVTSGGSAAPRNVVAPTVSGTPQDGETLAAHDGTWTGDPAPAITRRWRRCDTVAPGTCADIPGATGPAYDLGAADVGKHIRVRARAENASGAEEADSEATEAVAAIPVASGGAPAILGTARVGETLTARDGTWTGTPPIAIARRWQRCEDALGAACSDVPGATGPTYALTTADALRHIRLVVTATNPGGSASRSAMIGPVAAATSPAEPARTDSTPGGGAVAAATSGPAPPPGDAGAGSSSSTAPLVARVAAPARVRLAAALAGRFAVGVSCTAACSVAARIEVPRSLARRLRLAAARPVVLARGSALLAAAGRAQVRVRFTARARNRLRRLRKVRARLVVEVRDASGTVVVRRRTALVLRR